MALFKILINILLVLRGKLSIKIIFCKLQSGFLFTRKFINLIYGEAYLCRATLSFKRKYIFFTHATSYIPLL